MFQSFILEIGTSFKSQTTTFFTYDLLNHLYFAISLLHYSGTSSKSQLIYFTFRLTGFMQKVGTLTKSQLITLNAFLHIFLVRQPALFSLWSIQDTNQILTNFVLLAPILFHYSVENLIKANHISIISSFSALIGTLVKSQ